MHFFNLLEKVDSVIHSLIKRHLLMIFFVAITVIALYMRWVCKDWESGDYQIFLTWYQQIENGGGFRALKEQIGNYGEGYSLFLTLLTYLPISPLYGIKLFSVFFDFAVAIVAGMIVKKVKITERKSWKLASVLTYTTIIMLPTVILNGSYWGQCDTVYSAFCMLAILCVLNDKEKLSLVMMGLAFSIKMQAVLLLPVWILVWYQRKKLTLAHFLLIPGTYLIVCIPAIIAGKNIGTIFGLFSQFGSGPFGVPYQGLNNLSVFLLPTDPYIARTLVNILLWFTITLVGVSMLFWIIKNIDISDQIIFIAICLFYVVMTTETLGGLHERHAMLADLISVVLFFIWKKEWWFIPLVLNTHSFLGYVRYCTVRWDEEMTNVYMTTFMIEAIAYLLFVCWLLVFLYKECSYRNKVISY